MPVNFYEWGHKEGGASTDGAPSAPASAAYGSPDQFEGILGAAITTVSFSSSTKSITVRNTHDSDSLEYRFGSETEWFTIGPYGEVTAPVSVLSMQLRSVGAGNPTYEVLGILTS